MSDTALISLPEENLFTIFTTEGGIGEHLDKLDRLARDELESLKASIDPDTDAGREELKRLAAKVTKTKTAWEEIGADLTRKQKLIPNIIIANRNLMKQTCDDLRDEIRKPADDWEAKEKKRKAAHVDRIEYIKRLADTSDLTSAEILGAITALNQVEITDALCDEFIGEYQIVFDETKESLNSDLAIRKKQEEEHAELETLRKEKAAREELDRKADEEAKRVQREKDIAAEAEERGKREAEQAAQVEASRKAHAEATAKAEEDRRIADKEHRRMVNNEVLEGLEDVSGLGREAAMKVIGAIVEGKIPHVSIRY